jgi:hypothetical protein
MSIPSSRSSELLAVLRQVGWRDHLVLIYERKEEQIAVAIPAVRMGIARREKRVYDIMGPRATDGRRENSIQLLDRLL